MIRERQITSCGVWRQILKENPEIKLLFPFPYIPSFHREPGDLAGQDMPTSYRNYYTTESFLAMLRNWEEDEPRGEEIAQVMGIVGIVGIGIAQEQEWRFIGRYEDWELVRDFEPEREGALLFIDIEIHYSKKTTEMITGKITQMGVEGYLLRSNASYHFISSELTSLDELPARYGRFINAMAGDEPRWGWVRTIGDALIKAEDRSQVRQVCLYILSKVGHHGQEGERWFWVDLRHIAHSLLEFPVLRISGRSGYPNPPVLLAKFEGKREDESDHK